MLKAHLKGTFKICHLRFEAVSNYLQSIAIIAIKLSQSIDNGFVLEEPNIQVFERKPKAQATAAPWVA